MKQLKKKKVNFIGSRPLMTSLLLFRMLKWKFRMKPFFQSLLSWNSQNSELIKLKQTSQWHVIASVLCNRLLYPTPTFHRSKRKSWDLHYLKEEPSAVVPAAGELVSYFKKLYFYMKERLACNLQFVIVGYLA